MVLDSAYVGFMNQRAKRGCHLAGNNSEVPGCSTLLTLRRQVCTGWKYRLILDYLGFSGGSVVKNLPVKAGDAGYVGRIPGSGRSSGGGNSNPLQYPCPGKFHGQRRLVGFSPWSHRESDVTELLSMHMLDYLRGCQWGNISRYLLIFCPFFFDISSLKAVRAHSPLPVFLGASSVFRRHSVGFCLIFGKKTQPKRTYTQSLFCSKCSLRIILIIMKRFPLVFECTYPPLKQLFYFQFICSLL